MEVRYSENHLSGITAGNELFGNMTQLLALANKRAILDREGVLEEERRWYRWETVREGDQKEIHWERWLRVLLSAYAVFVDLSVENLGDIPCLVVGVVIF